jgi:hypothetical protein
MGIYENEIESIFKPTLKHALACFEEAIVKSGIFTAGALENIMTARTNIGRIKRL